MQELDLDWKSLHSLVQHHKFFQPQPYAQHMFWRNDYDHLYLLQSIDNLYLQNEVPHLMPFFQGLQSVLVANLYLHMYCKDFVTAYLQALHFPLHNQEHKK